MAATVEALKKLDGFIAAALVDSSSGMMLESVVVGSFPVEIAAAANTEVVQAKLKAMDAIDLGDDHIEDILIILHAFKNSVFQQTTESVKTSKYPC